MELRVISFLSRRDSLQTFAIELFVATFYFDFLLFPFFVSPALQIRIYRQTRESSLYQSQVEALNALLDRKALEHLLRILFTFRKVFKLKTPISFG